MNNEKIIGEMVAHDYRTAAIFKKYNIDFCCQGNRTLEEACQGIAVSPDQVMEDLAKITEQQNDAEQDFNSWPLDLLVDYVEKKHHRYVETATAQLKPYLEKFAMYMELITLSC